MAFLASVASPLLLPELSYAGPALGAHRQPGGQSNARRLAPSYPRHWGSATGTPVAVCATARGAAALAVVALTARRQLAARMCRGRRLRCARAVACRAGGAGGGVAALRIAREPQVVSFVEPSTGSEVVIVACMHYNPCSIAKSAAITRRLVDEQRLGAVVLETCPTRWSKVQELQPPGSQLRAWLDNEFQAAADEAAGAGRPVVLGDQRVEDVVEKVGEAARQALSELASPLDGGWLKLGGEVFRGFVDLISSRASRLKDAEEGQALGIQDLLDLDLIAGFPVAVVRYIAAFGLKAPLLLAGLIAFFVIASSLPSPFSDVVLLVWEILLLRILLCTMLMDRNQILARSIIESCQTSGGPGRAIVAVLGAAHCNGVWRLLLDADAPLDVSQASNMISDDELLARSGVSET
eukprot:CAMPEP_0203852068 /NCGR_PEP_ID=MMETSP0359-20131031/7707_1 /ASSEMBLY_ACC=CAM_ASM_000338 /TAXON_ID=268821 /ORGANISM="Scrippsiella Hangoei, Strain SHTV-5" /LENGTH=409 /DNA_ID=CAMNT_0050768161 /DNA_START=64 /DNA_END=1293 /DNA_ORIENTATION=-